ncbi:TlpA disulfide reductase family protein [Flavilitoribacter nigricans]|uniref:Thioredoxin domain-containing protein n=1 Tax=Flavilitoribacter nigricans (strain ATCC 23147 / DSM 23189 / NBRC 102662 / NCIMB 1420 / SS-2) TaxID=1122177 RepID=A0A2D0NDU5_FLAN2|nr:TlpA disulfide reductase family protein [Flavilitoribacter nigricans]PHN06578.1 hypothetical protein CRP01_09745 [Flavilitoribacter nigricans DSM 23189 = NBRC 102662]
MHRSALLLLSTTLALYLPLFSQTRDTTFRLNGSLADIESGTVQIWQPRSDSSFYVFENGVPIRQGKFQFNGHLQFPQTTNLGIFDENGTFLFDSGWFYIDPGEQEVHIKSAQEVISITSNATSFREYAAGYQPVNDSLDLIRRNIIRELDKAKFASLGLAVMDSLNRLKVRLEAQQGIFLMEYVLAHPQSFVSLDEISASISLENYVFAEKAFFFLDPELKNTVTGQEIQRKIDRVKALEIGRRFPDFGLLDTAGVSTSLHQMEGGRLLLIDFWFNSCGFCIQQFPELRQLYKRYQPKGLEIIGITVDKERFAANWKKAIRTHQLPWPQYWDFNGLQSADYLIRDFPTNFLLNDRGEIIGRNLALEELQLFLEERL